jgi:hypothetical protein
MMKSRSAWPTKICCLKEKKPLADRRYAYPQGAKQIGWAANVREKGTTAQEEGAGPNRQLK